MTRRAAKQSSPKTGPESGPRPVLEPALIPEFAVSNWRTSRDFYCDQLGFSVLYDRTEEGFAMLVKGDGANEVRLMIDQIGEGRSFDDGHMPQTRPFGRGVNLQIRVGDLDTMLAQLEAAGTSLYLPLEERWYRRDAAEMGNRQFVVADPDGYLLRFFEDLGTRPIGAAPQS